MTTIEKQILYVFNKYTKAFIREVKEAHDECKPMLKKHYICYDKSTDQYLNDFKAATDDADVVKAFLSGDICDNPKIDKIEVLKEIPAELVKINSKTHYLYMFFLLSKLHTDALENVSNERVTASLKAILVSTLKISNGGYDVTDILDEVYDDDYKSLMSSVQSTRVEEFKAGSPPDIDSDASSPFEMMGDTKIGKLAQEISTQIDMSSIKSENITSINDLFSGDNSAMSGIIQQVSSVMSDKLKTGELNQEELMSEAFSMMGNMKNTNFMQNIMQMQQM